MPIEQKIDSPMLRPIASLWTSVWVESMGLRLQLPSAKRAQTAAFS